MSRFGKAKPWLIGIGTTGFYLLFAGGSAGLSSCTGACGACSFGCMGSLVPILTAGGLVVAKKRKDLRKNREKGGAQREETNLS